MKSHDENRRCFSRVLALVVLAHLSGRALAQAPAPGQAAVWNHLTGVIENFERVHKARVGVSIVHLPSSTVCLAHRAEEGFIPASNQKLLTSAFALARLGENGTFTTALHVNHRDAVLTGQFDPLLCDPVLAREQGKDIYAELDRWSAALRETFGQTIPGDVILASRSTAGDFHPPSWDRRHFDVWYGAPVVDLGIHNNCYDVTFASVGGSVQPVVTPASRYIRVVNTAKFLPGGKHLWRLSESDDGAALTLMGQIRGPAADPLSVPMRDPRVTLGRVFADRLARAGVRIGGRLRVLPAGQVNLSGLRLRIDTQTPLRLVLQRSNKDSLNLAAECMLLRAGDGSWGGSTQQMHAVLVEKFGLTRDSLVLRDGSGLSRENRLCPKNLTVLLSRLAAGEWRDVILASLSRSGVDGSLRRRLNHPACKGRIAAKTGTIAAVRTLSGYVLSPDGEPLYAFSILANDLRGNAQYAAKQLQDQLCRILVEGK